MVDLPISCIGLSFYLFFFFPQIKYVSGGYDSAEGFLSLNKEISEHELAKNSYGSSRRLFYLALPPSVYPSVCKMIRSYCMNQGSFIFLLPQYQLL
jgi:glucose-6-phosphate 1-dehydrogenase